ncbi:hypothetical protein KXV45_004942 [Aspergillus fumigatus]|nr:hypothetical protein KXV45_004942 [Aspergillus fumigatus]
MPAPRHLCPGNTAAAPNPFHHPYVLGDLLLVLWGDPLYPWGWGIPPSGLDNDRLAALPIPPSLATLLGVIQ